MGGQQVMRGVGRTTGRVKCFGQVHMAFVVVRVVQRTHKVNDLCAILCGFPPSNVVCNFGGHSGKKRAELAFTGESGLELVSERGIALVQHLLPTVEHLKRIALLDFVHVHAVAVHQNVVILRGVDEFGFVEITRKESDFTDEQAPLLPVGLDAGKPALIGAAGNHGACNHVGKRLQGPFRTLVKTHLPDLNETRRVDSLNGGGLPGHFLYQCIGNGIDIGRTKTDMPFSSGMFARDFAICCSFLPCYFTALKSGLAGASAGCTSPRMISSTLVTGAGFPTVPAVGTVLR